MKEIFQALQDAFPILHSHPLLMARLFVAFLLLSVAYRAKETRKKICKPLCSKLADRILRSSRGLYVYRTTRLPDNWRYYTVEFTGKGIAGDDVIWTLVKWPSLSRQDSFRMQGAIGTVNGPADSEAKLQARWKIEHVPDANLIGQLPANGLMSVLQRVAMRVLMFVGSVE